MARRVLRILLVMLLMLAPEIAFAELRVISLYPGHSDNIAALAGEKSRDILVALSENDDADLLPEVPRVSLRVGAEKLLAMKPDLIVTRPFAEKLNPNLYSVLRISGVKVLSIEPPMWENFPEYLQNLADELQLDAKPALEKLANLKRGISEKAKSHDGKILNVFIESTGREIHTCAPDSWAAKLLELTGAYNVAKNASAIRPGSSIAAFGIERVLESVNSGLDVYIIQTGAMNHTNLAEFYGRSWTGAMKNSGVRVVEVPEKYLSRPSLLGLEIGGNLLMKIFWE